MYNSLLHPQLMLNPLNMRTARRLPKEEKKTFEVSKKKTRGI
jgi:hypothetical protein